jgi:hypothetical protein
MLIRLCESVQGICLPRSLSHHEAEIRQKKKVFVLLHIDGTDFRPGLSARDERQVNIVNSKLGL